MFDTLDRHPLSGRPSPDTATLPELMATYAVPGISIAAYEGDTRWATGHGTVGAGLVDPVTPDTPFQACSISKHVAAFGTLRLVADGVLDLDADIHDYLTSWQLPAPTGQRPVVTVRQLLAHTAGLSGMWFRGYEAGEPTPSLLQSLRGEPPANTPPVRAALLPGSRFRYSGSHYTVLQQLLIDVTGTPFPALMRRLVLAPLGMATSSFDQTFPYGRVVARGHHGGGTPVRGGWRTLPETAAAGLWTTPLDLLRLAGELSRASTGGSALLPRDLAAQMLTPQAPGGYGLGAQVDGPDRFGHTGGNVGYRCFSFAWPGSGAALAVLANSEDAEEILRSIMSVVAARYAPGTGNPAVPGRYLPPDGQPVEITIAAGAVVFTAGNQPAATLERLPGGRYRHPTLDVELTFRPHGLELRQEGSVEHYEPR